MATQTKLTVLEAGQKLPKKLDGLDLVIQLDVDATAEVAAAQIKRAEELLNRGARPRVLWLGKGEKPEEALNGALWAPEAIALWRMNQEVAYIRNPGMILVRKDGRVMFSDAFVKHAYSNWHYEQTVLKEGKKEPTLKQTRLAERWLEWKHRFELERVTYAPGQPRIHDGMWNTWRRGCEPLKSTREDVRPFYELLGYLLHDEGEWAVRWVLRWLAYPLQRPGTKMFTSVLLWGGQGVGKSLVGHTMKRIYGGNASVVSAKHLNGNFNSWAANKQFVMGEEMTGDDSRERRKRADELKNLITQLEMTINKKYQPEYVVPDCVNYYLTSNHPDALSLEDDDRRFAVFHASRPPIYMPDSKKSEAFYTAYAKWMHGDGPRHLLDHLLHLDLGDFNPSAPAPKTVAKEAMTSAGKSDVATWIQKLREDPTSALRAAGSEAKARECALFTSEELRRAYDPAQATQRLTTRVMGIELARAGFRQVHRGKPVTIWCKKERLWAVRDADKWCKAVPSAITAHCLKFQSKKL